MNKSNVAGWLTQYEHSAMTALIWGNKQKSITTNWTLCLTSALKPIQIFFFPTQHSLIAERLILLLFPLISSKTFKCIVYFTFIFCFSFTGDSFQRPRQACLVIFKSYFVIPQVAPMCMSLLLEAIRNTYCKLWLQHSKTVKPPLQLLKQPPVCLFGWSFALSSFHPPSDPSRWESRSPLQSICPWPH